MSEINYSRLFAFFQGYFHEDWDVDDSNAEGVVVRFVQDNPGQEVARVTSELDALLETEPSTAQLEALIFDQGGCYYDPSADGIALRDWLVSVRDTLRGSV